MSLDLGGQCMCHVVRTDVASYENLLTAYASYPLPGTTWANTIPVPLFPSLTSLEWNTVSPSHEKVRMSLEDLKTEKFAHQKKLGMFRFFF